jgi:peptidoglycan/xylan/chitin deacetylase (PgdA/CDA1 family)
VNDWNVIIFSSAEPPQVKQLLKHLTAAFPDVSLSVLYENPRPSLPIAGRRGQGLSFTSSLAFIRSAFCESPPRIRAASIWLLDLLLRLLHAAPKYPNAKSASVDELKGYAESKRVEFFLTEDSCSQTSKEFVRRLQPDIGAVYGAPIRGVDLLAIPTKGSITLDVRDHINHRGAESHRLPEAQKGWAEQTISARYVSVGNDEAAAIAERRFPIEEYDTLESVGIKTSLLSVECLVDAIRSEQGQRCIDGEARGASATAREDGQTPSCYRATDVILRNRNRFRPAYGRPLIKLLARFPLYPIVWLSNLRRWANRDFPIVILFGHVIADRPHFMGVSTDQFLKQVRFLKKHYRISSLPQAIKMFEKGKIPAPTVVLTFDDGYEDNHLGLRAVIDWEEIPVALFVCTKNVDEHRPFDHDLERGESDFFPLTWDQLKDFERQGSTIGSHTRTHFDCGSNDEGLLRDEIAGSQEDLQNHLGRRVPYFSFPWGHPKNMSHAALTIASETYPYVFAAYGGINNSRAHPFPVFKRAFLPRNLLELELSLQGLLNFHRDEMFLPSAVAREVANLASAAQ